MKVWKVMTDLTVEEGDMIQDIFTDEDGDFIRSLDENEEIFSWDFVDGEIYIPYLLCTKEVAYAIRDICDKYAIKLLPIDITEDFLMGLYKIPDSDFEDYRLANLNEDLVYSKIAKFGVESLDEVDKYVLHNI